MPVPNVDADAKDDTHDYCLGSAKLWNSIAFAFTEAVILFALFAGRIPKRRTPSFVSFVSERLVPDPQYW